MASKPKKTKVPKRKKVAKPSPADELAEALRRIVARAEAVGWRDLPDIAHAKEVLARHAK